jgi:hypothetical protein
MTETTNSSQGPVTLEDVRAALNGTDPTATNAGALRKLLGRGSNATIQKHLDTLRAESVVPVADLTGAAPDAPKELTQAIWQSAWTYAQARTSGALAQAHAREQALSAALTTAQADTQAAQGAADSAADDLIQAVQAAHEAAQAHAAAIALTRMGEAVAVQALETERNARAMEQAQHTATVATLQGEIDRLVNQLADLRAALGNRDALR